MKKQTDFKFSLSLDGQLSSMHSLEWSLLLVCCLTELPNMCDLAPVTNKNRKQKTDTAFLLHHPYKSLTREEYLGDRMDIFPIPQDEARTCAGRHNNSAVTETS